MRKLVGGQTWVEWCPPPPMIYVHVQIAGICECDFIWKKASLQMQLRITELRIKEIGDRREDREEKAM